MSEAARTTAQLAPAPQPRRVAIVLNGRAGALLDRPDAALGMEEMFAEAGLNAEIIPPEAGSLTERIAQAHRTGPEIIAVAGGDGTIACAAQALAGTDATLGILPFGTMNLLARDLAIPTGDIEAAVRVLATGRPRRIDVGEVGGRVFLCASMLGLPAALGRHREASRGGRFALRRWLYFARAALRTTRSYVPRRLILDLDGQTSVSRAPSITVTVNRLDDASGRLFARARLDGGELGVYLAERPRFRDIPALVFDLLRGRWQAGGVVEERRGRTLAVRTGRRTLRVMNDGEETILPVPVVYRVRPGALSVIAPPQA